MPPIGKGKTKMKDGRQSRSRNTTPGSVVSATASTMAASTMYLEIDIGKLMIPSNILYDDILERHGGSGGIPDPKHLEALAGDLNTLSLLAQSRGSACDGGMRKLSDRRKEKIEEERELELATREAEEKANLKRVAEDEELERGRKSSKVKKRKDRSMIREERPLTHGAHGVARQDGLLAGVKASEVSTPIDTEVVAKEHSPSKSKQATASGSSSSLSPPSQLQSPTVATRLPGADSARASPVPSSSSDDSHQPPPAASIPQHMTFGPDPLHFDDPTTYHIRQMLPNMTDEQKAAIYGVTSFPKDDLADLVAGVVPDKDFSNAKPSNQVNANTFAAYLEPYLRPLNEEDLAWLKERGDRVTPFIIPRRGKKHYSEVWAEEDAASSVDAAHHGRDKLPANQARGSLEQIDDETVETDQISAGPLTNRLLSAMRYEHRAPTTDDTDKTNGTTNGNGESSTLPYTNGDSSVGNTNGEASTDDHLSPATAFPESSQPGWKVPNTRLEYPTLDERLKQELRYIGFVGPDEEADYDAHLDDEVCQRLRYLQSELKQQMIINGARKARLLQLTQERMAYQEYKTILDDLDMQVVQAYQKRNRTLGKGKKNAKRPGGAGGGSHYAPGGSAGTAKPGLGDSTKALLEKRRKWIDTIGPIFSKDVTKVRTAGDNIFTPDVMGPLMEAERERLEEELAEAL